MSSRVSSLTETALLNPTVLNWLYPPNSQEIKITNPSNSIVETLRDVDSNLYSDSLINSPWHVRMKPIRFIGRGIYTTLVLSLISPLGIILNGASTLAYGGLHLWHKVNSETGQAESEKVTAYAKAFFTDFTSFIVGLMNHVPAFLCAGMLLYLADNLLVGYLISMRLPLCLFFIALGESISHGCHAPDESIPRMVAYKDEKVGMFLSLAARNQLGFTGKDGKLLPFSSADQMKYEEIENLRKYNYNETRYTYQFQTSTLSEAIAETEKALIDVVREINRILNKHNLLRIEHSYPFDGEAIANFIQGYANSYDDLVAWIPKLKAMNRKIRVLRGLENKAKEIALTVGPMSLDFRNHRMYLAGPSRPSYLSQEAYLSYWSRPI